MGYTQLKMLEDMEEMHQRLEMLECIIHGVLTVDKVNNRVLSTNYYKQSVQAFDLDLNFDKEFGGSAGTRMSGAHEAIQSIVTDSSLTAGVNFGFGYWSWDNNGSGFRILDWRYN